MPLAAWPVARSVQLPAGSATVRADDVPLKTASTSPAPGSPRKKESTPPAPPEPDVPGPVTVGTISTVEKAIGDAIRRTYRETADLQDAGKLQTAEAMLADESARFDRHFDAAVQALANREQAETQPGWTPKKSAAYRRKVAGEP